MKIFWIIGMAVGVQLNEPYVFAMMAVFYLAESIREASKS